MFELQHCKSDGASIPGKASLNLPSSVSNLMWDLGALLCSAGLAQRSAVNISKHNAAN